MNKTGVQALASPCAVVGFYAASATVALVGVAAANSGELTTAAKGINWPTIYSKVLDWTARWRGPTGAVTGAIALGKQICNSY